jgi:MYXO-CTERM domain-containing protein
VVGGYTVQSIFSNLANQCVPSRVATSDFTVSLASNRKVLAGSSSVTVPITTATTGTDLTPVSLTLSIAGLPAPHVTGSLNSTSLTSGNGAMLTLNADATATAVRGAVVQVKAVAGSNVHTAGLLLVVVPAGASTASDFNLSLSSASTTAMQGQSGAVTVTCASTAGVPEVVTLSAAGLPSGVTAQFSPATVMAGGDTMLTLFADPSAPLVTNAQFTVNGTSASATRSTSGTVTVTPPPAPPTASITRPANGATVSGVVQINATGAPSTGATLTQMNLLVDGLSVATLPSSPAQFAWQSTSVANGSHALVVQSVDNTLATGISAIVNVTVNNAPPPPPPGQKGGCASSGAGLAALLGLLAIRRRRRVT